MSFDFDSDSVWFTKTSYEDFGVESMRVFANELANALGVSLNKEVTVSETRGVSWQAEDYRFRFNEPVEYSDHVEQVYEDFQKKFYGEFV